VAEMKKTAGNKNCGERNGGGGLSRRQPFGKGSNKFRIRKGGVRTDERKGTCKEE